MKPLIFLVAILTTFAFVAACGGGSSGSKLKYTPIPGNSELIVGKNRISMAVVDQQNNPFLADPGNSLQMQFRDSKNKLVGAPETATFVSAIPGTSGFWVLNHQFQSAGQVEATVTVHKGAAKQVIDLTFNVKQKGNAPAIGDPAPPTENATLTNQPNKKQLTTDPQPDDAFYQLTVTQALAAHKPFVVVFATPAFCQFRLCGPALDIVKTVQPDFAGRVNFIHIEPYKLNENGGLAGNQLTPAQSTDDWHLQSEPWAFVVGADGKIADRFEGVASPEELKQAILAVLS
jgi:hypothetical protein